MLIWVVGAVAAVAGILLGYWLRSTSAKAQNAAFEALAAEREKNAARLREELQGKSESERNLAARVSGLEAELRNERQNLAEKLALLETAKKTLSDQFQTLATEVLEAKSKTFSEASQTQVGALLEPLKTKIEEFRKKVEEAQTDSKTGVTKLETLIGTLGGLNQQLTEEARNLTTALRGSSKAQGDWGEFISARSAGKGGAPRGRAVQFSAEFYRPRK